MRGLLSVTLVASLLGIVDAFAQTDLPSDRGARQSPNSLSQNSNDRTSSGNASGNDRNALWLHDPKSHCAARSVASVSTDGVAWSGHCAGGLANGPGTATFFNQGKFVESVTGDFDEGAVRDGHLIMKRADGSTYEGGTIGARMEGSGRFITAAGDRFEGQWADDRMNGHGLAVWSNGDRYEGEWRDGKAEGHGVQTWSDGHKYDGEWHADLPNGHGVVTRADGSRYEADFANGRLVDGTQKPAATPAAFETAADAAPTSVSAAKTTQTTQTKDATAHDHAASDGAASAQHSGFSDISGRKFFAIDGSTLALTAEEDGLTREIVAPNGTVKRNLFAFLNDRQGSVSEDGSSTITGIFRLTEKGIATDYSDGRSELLVPNKAGGVSMMVNAPTGVSYCMAWYPQGHQFTTGEREAALAEYASRLGLTAPRHKASKQTSKADCLSAQDDAQRGPSVYSPPRTVAKRTSALHAGTRTSLSLTHGEAAAPASLAVGSMAPSPHDRQIIEVRTSKVHAIDAMAPADSNMPAANELASASGGTDKTSASTCLSVESDGTHWNFRNHCAYDVQFAYCQMNASDPLTSCSKGAVSGSVAPNGFSALVADRSLNETNADHDFRWVACGGGAGEVVVHLDRVDPPVGRCVRPGAS